MDTSWKENEPLNDYSFPQGQRCLAWYITYAAPTGLDGCWPLSLSKCLSQDKLTTGNDSYLLLEWGAAWVTDTPGSGKPGGPSHVPISS